MADLATLAVKIEARDAIAQTKALGQAMDKTGVSAEVLEKRAAALARVQAQVAAATGQQRAMLGSLLGPQAAVARGFTSTAASTERMRGVLATLGGTARTASMATVAGGAAIAGAFGPGSIAALAVISFGNTLVREMLRSRREMDETEKRWKEMVAGLVNDGNVGKLSKLSQDLFLGTPAESFKDGIREAQRIVDELEARNATVFGGLSNIFNPEALETARANLKRLTDQFDELRRRIADPTNAPARPSGALPWEITARGGPDARAQWEEQRRHAAERARWDEEEILRLFRIAEAAHRANVARLGGTVSPRGTTTLGTAASPFTPNGFAGGVQRLPAGFGAGNALTNFDPLASAREAAAIEAESARYFRENIQQAAGDFIGTFVSEGRVSIRELFAGVQSLGGSILGQTVSRVLTPRIDALSTGGQLLAGGGLAVLGSVVTSFLDSGAAARRMAQAFRDVDRSIFEYGAFARNFGKSEAELDLERQRSGRDAEARKAFAAANSGTTTLGFGYSGDPVADMERIRALLAVTPNISATRNIRKALEELLGALGDVEEQFKANSEAARKMVAQQKIAGLTQTVDTLRSFQSSLRLSDLSIYNPFQQQDEARRVYEEVLAKARGGDQGAAGQLPAAARAFLEQSRGINASGSRYVADFQRVERETGAVQAIFEGQRSTQQGILDGTIIVGEKLTELTTILTRTEPYQQAQLTVQQAGFSGLILEVKTLRLEAQEQNRALRLDLEALRMRVA